MNQVSIEKDLTESIALLKRIQDAIDFWRDEPEENSHELAKAFGDRETTTRRIVALCEEFLAGLSAGRDSVPRSEFKDAQSRIARLEAELHLRQLRDVDLELSRAHYYSLIDQQEHVNREEPNLRLRIHFSQYLTRHDLSAILSRLDKLVEIEIVAAAMGEASNHSSRASLKKELSQVPHRTFVGITSIDKGSVDLYIQASSYVLGILTPYITSKLAKGFKKSHLAPSLENVGMIVGDALANVVNRFAIWMNVKFVPQSPDLKVELTSIGPGNKAPRRRKRTEA